MGHSTGLTAEGIGNGTRNRLEDDMEFRVATRLDDVVAAWRLVYDAYAGSGLIDPNPWQIHTVPKAIHHNNVVICAGSEEEAVSTLTIIHDSEGIPLDDIYPDELDGLRDRGRSLMEIGLLADRREQVSRSLPALLEMMRYVFYRSRFTDSDIMIGVHPHHGRYYRKYFGFEDHGPTSTHPTVNHNPVVLMRLDLNEKLKLDPLPRGLAMYVANPLPSDTFDQKFAFHPERVEKSPIGLYLRNAQVPAMATAETEVNGEAA